MVDIASPPPPSPVAANVGTGLPLLKQTFNPQDKVTHTIMEQALDPAVKSQAQPGARSVRGSRVNILV